MFTVHITHTLLYTRMLFVQHAQMPSRTHFVIVVLLFNMNSKILLRHVMHEYVLIALGSKQSFGGK